MNFWTRKQDDKEYQKEQARLLKEWEELQLKRLKERREREITNSIIAISANGYTEGGTFGKKPEGWDY